MQWTPTLRPGAMVRYHRAPSRITLQFCDFLPLASQGPKTRDALLKGLEGLDHMKLAAMDEKELIARLRKENGLSEQPGN